MEHSVLAAVAIAAAIYPLLLSRRNDNERAMNVFPDLETAISIVWRLIARRAVDVLLQKTFTQPGPVVVIG